MSKYIKNLVSDHLRNRLQGVDDALLVNVVGINANASNRLRSELAGKNIHLIVVKNSLAARATAGTRLSAMFEGLAGCSAICWGGEDIVSLAKEVIRVSRDERYAPFAPRGGVMDGERLDAAQVEQVSKLPSRMGQLAILVGQILGPGARLASQLSGPGGAVASQVASLGEKKEEEAPPPAA